MSKAKSELFMSPLIKREHSIPYCRRSGLFEANRWLELAFTNAMHQLNAGNDEAGIFKPFEPEHDVDPGLDVPMVLLNQVV